MTTQTRRSRDFFLKGALAMLILAAGLVASPRLVQDAYAWADGCNVKCGGGSCSASPEEGERCTCSCDLIGMPVCTCKQLRPSTDG
ncbi:MAG TPA: hypothetical protein VHG28_25210 [Longimicrobiaceae bacterium]|nr:hypothetical protein [Longimicrobiaceae bacterium]